MHNCTYIKLVPAGGMPLYITMNGWIYSSKAAEESNILLPVLRSVTTAPSTMQRVGGLGACQHVWHAHQWKRNFSCKRLARGFSDRL
jgi:hypothetical protein